MTKQETTLLDLCLSVLNTAEPELKIRAAERVVSALAEGVPTGNGTRHPPDRPMRPDRPALLPPTKMPRRRFGSEKGRAALLHAIAHIEFNAIDLAFDMAARFAGNVENLGLNSRKFVSDWINVGGDEARHFGLINARLRELDFRYGDFPAHDGLWEAAENTAGNLLARLAIAPLILEARGLDVTPSMIDSLRAEKDEKSAQILAVIYNDEIGHVACGKKWFFQACAVLDQDPAETFQHLKSKFFAGALKPPFNHDARAKAGLPRHFYDPN